MTKLKRRNFFYILIILAASAFYIKFIYSASFIFDGRKYYTLFDDAMISMRYAKNFAAGYGLVWNPGEYVEGYTNFLWTIWMSALHLLPFHESKMSMLVSLSGVVILILNIIVVKSLAEKISNNSFFSISLSMIFTAFYFGLIFWTLRGMEVGLLTLLTCYSLLLLFRLQDLWAEKDFVKLIVSLSLMLLLRTDSIVLILFFLACFYFTIHFQNKIKKILLIAIVMILVVAVQTLFRSIYYDDLLPNTYYLKLGGISLSNRFERGWDSFENIFSARLIPLVLPVILYLIFYYKEIEKRRVFCLIGLFLLTSVYSIYIGGDSWEWMPYTNRFITVSISALIILFSLSVEKLFLRFRSSKIFWISATAFLVYTLTIIIFFLNTLPEYDYTTGNPWINKTLFISVCVIFIIVLACVFIFKKNPVFLKMNAVLICAISFLIINEYAYSTWLARNAFFEDQDTNNARLGLILKTKTSEDTRIADLWAGNGPYFSNRYSIDLLGKMDKHIAKEKPNEEFFLPGHSKWDHLYSIKEYKPDIILSLKEKPEGELKKYLDENYDLLEKKDWYIKKGTTKFDKNSF